jgi:hypothetical protein
MCSGRNEACKRLGAKENCESINESVPVGTKPPKGQGLGQKDEKEINTFHKVFVFRFSKRN